MSNQCDLCGQKMGLHKNTCLDQLLNNVGPAIISEFANICVEDEIANFLTLAMRDRLERKLTQDEIRLINFVASGLQQSYRRQWRKMRSR